MQRLWEASKDATPEDLQFQISELRAFCKPYTLANLEAARKRLQADYEYRTWPKIADWHKAILATMPVVPKTDPNDYPWVKRDREAEVIYNHEYKNTPLWLEMEYLNIESEYKNLMLQAIKNALRSGKDGHDCVLGEDWITYLRMKAERYKQGSMYRDQHPAELMN